MVDLGLRDFGSITARRDEPTLSPPSPPDSAPPPPAATADVIVPPAPPSRQPMFGTKAGATGPTVPLESTIGRIAELIAHRRTATPLVIGFVGGPGSGKTTALTKVGVLLDQLGAGATRLKGSPFLQRVHVQHVDAATLDGDVASALAATVHQGLASYPDLDRTLGDTGTDPHLLVQELNGKLDSARDRLDSERRALEDAGSRRANLSDTVLHQSASSQIDVYARSNRARIERRLAGFGLAGADPIRRYKELVQQVAASGNKVGFAVRSLWAYRNQTKLLVTFVLLLVAASGLGVALGDQTTWLDQLRAGPRFGAGLADWLAAHAALFGHVQTLLIVLAIAALLLAAWRAFAFVTPIFKGEQLLASDLAARRPDLDTSVAHQTKRVDALVATIDRLGREIGQAEARAGAAGGERPHRSSPFAIADAARAQAFFAALTDGLAGDGKNGPVSSRVVPDRVVLLVDHLDAVPVERARAILDALHRSVGPGMMVVLAADPSRLDPDGSRRHELARWVEIPVRLDAGADDEALHMLVGSALGRGTAAPASVEAGTSVLDVPLDEGEEVLLQALAPLAGPTPRGIRRFVSFYSLARLEGEMRLGPLAFLLALAQGGTAAERALVVRSLASTAAPTATFVLPAASARVRNALAAAIECDGAFTSAELADAARVAARFSLPEPAV